MSAVGKIISNHTPTPASTKEAKEQKAKTDEIVKELAVDPTPPKSPVNAEKRGPGRPRKNSQSPKRKGPLPELPTVGKDSAGNSQKTAGEVAAAIRNRGIITQLRYYREYFPDLTEELKHYNPHAHSPEENLQVVQAIDDAVLFEIEKSQTPFIVEEAIKGAESAMLAAAVSNPGNWASKVALNFEGISGALLNDRPTVLELKLWQVKHATNLLPKEPWKRMVLNVLRIGSSVFRENFRAGQTQGPEDTSKFSGL